MQVVDKMRDAPVRHRYFSALAQVPFPNDVIKRGQPISSANTRGDRAGFYRSLELRIVNRRMVSTNF